MLMPIELSELRSEELCELMLPKSIIIMMVENSETRSDDELVSLESACEEILLMALSAFAIVVEELTVRSLITCSL